MTVIFNFVLEMSWVGGKTEQKARPSLWTCCCLLKTWNS